MAIADKLYQSVLDDAAQLRRESVILRHRILELERQLGELRERLGCAGCAYQDNCEEQGFKDACQFFQSGILEDDSPPDKFNVGDMVRSTRCFSTVRSGTLENVEAGWLGTVKEFFGDGRIMVMMDGDPDPHTFYENTDQLEAVEDAPGGTGND